MDRRKLLASMSAGGMVAFTGCTDPLFTIINSCSHSIPDRQESSASDGFPTISVSEEMPKQIRDEYSAAVWVDQQYSSQELAKLQIEVINNQNSTQENSWGPTPPFSGYRGEQINGEGVLWVVPSPPTGPHAGITHVDTAQKDYDPDEELSAPIEGCWKIEGVGYNSIARRRTVDPCASLTQKYLVYADATTGECILPGEYRFKSEHWEFTLDVEE